MRSLSGLLCALVMSGCFPVLTGAPCGSSLQCPTGQVCGGGRCDFADLVDAGAGGGVAGGGSGGGVAGGGTGGSGGGVAGGGTGGSGGGVAGGGTGGSGGGVAGGGAGGSGGGVTGGGTGGSGGGGGGTGGGGALLANGASCTSPAQCQSNVCQSYYRDDDSDGFGAGVAELRCGPTPPAGYVGKSGDCCDSEPLAFPGQTNFSAVARNAACGTTNTFDFDCSGTNDPETMAQPDSCSPNMPCNTCANHTGWALPQPPMCGQSQDYVAACQSATGSCQCPNATLTPMKVQRCR